MSKKRSYTLGKRAEAREETRRRIVEATMELHEEIGPRATSISAIAERAGVQRLTVYRHFPDEAAILRACSTHWLSLNPPPDPGTWAALAEGERRAAAAFAAFYGYYGRTQRMWTAVYRDLAEVAALQPPVGEFLRFLQGVGEELLRHLGDRGEAQPALAATVHHALAFQTWQSLEQQGLSDAAKVALVGRWIRAAMEGDG